MTELVDEPVFSAPWHAQLFALTVKLSENGHFGWREWTQIFGAQLAQNGLDRALDGGDDYFLTWLEALEAMLSAKGMAADAEISPIMAAWRDAYLRTPHGQPVKLAR